jgi:tetratricopeptide (TPR) repeat protein
VQKCLEYCLQALEIDAAYAPAHALVSSAYTLMGTFGYMKRGDVMARSIASAREALARDKALPEAHVALGHILYYFEWDIPGAEKEFRQAMEMDPNSAHPHFMLAELLIAMGRPQEAQAEAMRAVQLDPLSFNALFRLGVVLYERGRETEAAEQSRKALELNPSFDFAAYLLALTCSAQGKHEDAFSALANAADSRDTRAYRALIDAYAGHREEALGIANDLEREPRCDFARCTLSAAYGVLGEENKALAILDELFEERFGLLVLLNRRRFESLRGSPRFQDLLRRIGLAQTLSRG